MAWEEVLGEEVSPYAMSVAAPSLSPDLSESDTAALDLDIAFAANSTVAIFWRNIVFKTHLFLNFDKLSSRPNSS